MYLDPLVLLPERPDVMLGDREELPTEADRANEPACSRLPRTERIIRRVIEDVRTAVMLKKENESKFLY
jgi:hypothetical protein